MDKIYREKLDIKVAFESALKGTDSTCESQETVDVVADARVPSPSMMEHAGNWHLGSNLKYILRPLARLLFKMIRPFAKPIFARMRGFFLNGLRQELLDEIRRSSQQTSAETFGILSEVRRNAEVLANDVRVNHVRMMAEIVSSNFPLERIEQSLQRIEQYSVLAARRVALNSGPDIIIRTVVGYVLCPATDHALVTLLIEAGELERGTRLLIERLLEPGDTFLDVGANVGLHALAAARAMKGKGEIVAFEPFGPTKHLLDKTLWLNGFSSMAKVHEVAVSSRAGSAKLFLGATSGHHSLTPGSSSETSTEVRMVTLDEMIEGARPVDLIKIDVEGAELEVLQGAQSIIKNNRRVGLIAEFGLSHLERTGNTTRGWISTFTDMGFDYMAINPETGLLEAITVEELGMTDSVNLFFARSESSLWSKALKV